MTPTCKPPSEDRAGIAQAVSAFLLSHHPKNGVARGSTPRDRSDDRQRHRVQEDRSTIVLMLITVALVAGLSVLAYTLAVYALPFMLGVEAAKWAYASGSGLIGEGLVGLVACAAAYGLLIERSPMPSTTIRMMCLISSSVNCPLVRAESIDWP